MERGNRTVYPLSAQDALLSIIGAEKAARSLICRGLPLRQAEAVGANAALCAYSLRDGDGKYIFRNVWEVLEGLTLEEIACYAGEYARRYENCDEAGLNTGWGGEGE